MPQDQQQKTELTLDDFREQARERYGIPKGLWESVRSQESGGDPNAVSETGVRGEYQVTKKTAAGYGLDRDDPFHQIAAAAKNLREGYDHYSNLKDDNQRWLAATGYYYYGPGAVASDGTLSTKSKDGVSNPAEHITKVAKLWKSYNDSQPGAPAAVPQSAKPAPKTQTGFNPGDANDPFKQPQSRPQTASERRLATDEVARRNAAPAIAKMVNDFEALKSKGDVAGARSIAAQIKGKYGNWMEVGEGNGWPYVKSRVAGWDPVGPAPGPASTESPMVALERKAAIDDYNNASWLERRRRNIATGYEQGAQGLADILARGYDVASGALTGDFKPLIEQAEGAGRGLLKLASAFDPVNADETYAAVAKEQDPALAALERRRALRLKDDPYTIGSNIERQRLNEEAARQPGFAGAVTRGVTSGALQSLPYIAASALGGGVPTMGSLAAAQSDFVHPDEAALNIAGATLPIKVGRAVAPAIERVATSLPGKVLPAAARAGGQIGFGGATNVATALAAGERNPTNLAEQFVTGGALSAVDAARAARGGAPTVAPSGVDPSIIETASTTPGGIPRPMARAQDPGAQMVAKYVDDVRFIENTVPAGPEREAALEGLRQEYLAARRNAAAVPIPERQPQFQPWPRTPEGAIVAQPSSLPSRKLLPPAGTQQVPTERISDTDALTTGRLYPDAPETQQIPGVARTPRAEDLPTVEFPPLPGQRRTAPVVQQPEAEAPQRQTAQLPRTTPRMLPPEPTGENPPIRRTAELAPQRPVRQTAEAPGRPITQPRTAQLAEAALTGAPTNRITTGEGGELPRRVSRQPDLPVPIATPENIEALRRRPTERLPVPIATPENIETLRRRREDLSRVAFDRRGEFTGDLRDELRELGAVIARYEADQAKAGRGNAFDPDAEPNYAPAERRRPKTPEEIAARRLALEPGPRPSGLLQASTPGRPVTKEMQIPSSRNVRTDFNSREDARRGHFDTLTDDELLGEIRRLEDVKNAAIRGKSRLTPDEIEANNFDLKIAVEQQKERGAIQRAQRREAGERIAPRTPGRPAKRQPFTEYEGGELQRYSRPLEGQPTEVPTRFTEYEGGELRRYSRPLEGQPVEMPEAQERGAEKATAKPVGAESAGTPERLESVGLLRQYGDRWQYKFDIDGRWMTANSKEDAVDRAANTYRKLPEGERLTQAERGERDYAEKLSQWQKQYENVSTESLEQKLQANQAEQSKLNGRYQKHGINQYGTQRTASIAGQLDSLAQENNAIRAVLDARRSQVPTEQSKATAPETAPQTAETPTTVADHMTAIKSLNSGDLSAADAKRNMQWLLDNEAAIKAELNKLTIAGLKKQFFSYHAKTKADWVNAGYDSLVKGYTLDIPISYQMFRENFATGARRAMEQLTDEKIQSYATARREKFESIKKSVTNPETLQEFEDFIRMRKGGESALTPEQRARYDELIAEKNKSERRAEIEERATVRRVDVGDVGMDIKKHYHTKLGQDVHIVTMSERVDRAKYEELNQAAKRLGGWYSRAYQGSPAGFAFKTEDAAKQFVSLREGDVSQSERVQQREEAKQGRRVSALRTVAESLEGKANAALGADRKVNTYKRAQEASHAEARANADLAMAKTMNNLAEAIESGEAKHLDGVRAKTHIETLNSVLQAAKGERSRQIGESWEKSKDRPANEDDIQAVKYPYPAIHKEMIGKYIEALKGIPGAKLLADRLRAKQVAAMGDEKQWRVEFRSERDIADYEALIQKAGRKLRSYDLESLKSDGEKYKRLQAMGITDEPSLRAALREYLQFRKGAAKADPLKQAERELIGTKIPGFFPTPKAVVDRMLAAADVREGMAVLEPSAGKGSIADAIRTESGITPATIEVNSTLRKLLEMKGYTLADSDFLQHKGEYDRIVMNPPFENGQDIDHVRHAYSLLRPGGKVVAVMSEGPFGRSDKQATAFREWLESVGGESEKLPEGSFKDSDRSTGVNTRMVVIEKPAAQEAAVKRTSPAAAAETAQPTGQENKIAQYVKDFAERGRKADPEYYSTPERRQGLEERSRKFIEGLLGDIENRNVTKLAEVLHKGNPFSRSVFEQETGVSLGKTEKDLIPALKKWVGEEGETAFANQEAERQATKQRNAEAEKARAIEDKKYRDGDRTISARQMIDEHLSEPGEYSITTTKRGAVTSHWLTRTTPDGRTSSVRLEGAPIREYAESQIAKKKQPGPQEAEPATREEQLRKWRSAVDKADKAETAWRQWSTISPSEVEGRTPAEKRTNFNAELHRRKSEMERLREEASKLRPGAQPETSSRATEAEGWLKSLSDDQRERTLEVMRSISNKVEGAYSENRRLRPPQGTIGVGGADFDPMLKAESLASFVRGLNKGLTPDAALEAAKRDAREMIKNWNEKGTPGRMKASSARELDRYEGAADSYLEDAWRSVLNAGKEPKGEPKASTVANNKPFGDVPVSDESRFYGERVRVRPRNKTEEEYTGIVERVLNGGEAVEVRPDGEDSSFRVSGEQIEKLEPTRTEPASTFERTTPARKTPERAEFDRQHAEWRQQIEDLKERQRRAKGDQAEQKIAQELRELQRQAGYRFDQHGMMQTNDARIAKYEDALEDATSPIHRLALEADLANETRQPGWREIGDRANKEVTAAIIAEAKEMGLSDQDAGFVGRDVAGSMLTTPLVDMYGADYKKLLQRKVDELLASNKAAEEMGAARSNARKQVRDLPNLSDKQRTAFTERVRDASDQKELSRVMEQAKAADKEAAPLPMGEPLDAATQNQIFKQPREVAEFLRDVTPEKGFTEVKTLKGGAASRVQERLQKLGWVGEGWAPEPTEQGKRVIQFLADLKHGFTMESYTPAKGAIVDAPPSGWYVAKLKDGREAFSNGHFILTGAPPAKHKTAGSAPNFDRVFDPTDKDVRNAKTITPIGYAGAPARGMDLVFDNGTLIDSDYHDFIRSRFKDAEFRGTNKDDKVFIFSKGEPVGAIMPKRGETPKALKALIGQPAQAQAPAAKPAKPKRGGKGHVMGSLFGGFQPFFEGGAKPKPKTTLFEGAPNPDGLTRRERIGWKIGTAQTIAQLLNPKTISQNIIGNAAFSGAKNAAHLPALAIDKMLSAITKQRQVAPPKVRAQIQDFAKGFSEIYHAVRANDYAKLSDNRYELSNERVFKGKVGGFFEDVMNVALRAPDRGAYLAAYNDSVQQILAANAKSKQPFSLDKIHDQARLEAQQAVFQDSNVISNFAVKLRDALNTVTPFGKKSNFGLGDLIGLKYAKTPANLLARGIEYSPVGFANALYKIAKVAAGKGKGFDQRDASLAFGKAFVGSAFGSGLGAMLYSMGIISQPEQENRGVQAAERAEGLNGYQVNLSALKRYAAGGLLNAITGDLSAGKKQAGDVLMSYDWLQPWAFSLGMGAAAAKAFEKRKADSDLLEDALTQIDAVTSTLTDQSILRNIRDISKYGAKSTARRVVTDTPASFVPSILNLARQVIDDRAREVSKEKGAAGITREALEKVLNRLPGASDELPERKDVVGRSVPSRMEGAAGAAMAAVPGRFSKYNPHPVLTEMQATGAGATDIEPKDGESQGAFKARRALAAEWRNQYGLKLTASESYRNAPPERRKAALKYLESQISSQSAEKRPKKYLFTAAHIFEAVREAERNKNRKASAAEKALQ